MKNRLPKPLRVLIQNVFIRLRTSVFAGGHYLTPFFEYGSKFFFIKGVPFSASGAQ